MDDKEFRKLRREDLVEIIYQYQRREQRLTQENETLKNQLKERTIQIEQAGSIAQAALALNGVFEAAQQAADQYLESVKAMARAEGQPRKPQAAESPRPSQEPKKPEPSQEALLPPENFDPGFSSPAAAPQAVPVAQPVKAEKPAERPAPAKQERPSKPQRPQRPQKQAAPAAQKPAGKPQGEDTDEFISSLKDYLGM